MEDGERKEEKKKRKIKKKIFTLKKGRVSEVSTGGENCQVGVQRA